MSDPALPKPTRLDYGFMIGGPILFIAIALAGLHAILNPPHPFDPIQRLQSGDVTDGMTVDQVERQVGVPKAVVDNSIGGTTFRYDRTVFQQQSQGFAIVEGDVEFGPEGHVQDVKIATYPVNPGDQSQTG